MKYIEVKDLKIPALGYGTWKLEENKCVDAVKKALEIGYRHIDTAQIYKNEEYVGAGITGSSVPREDIFLTTKIWRDNFDKSRFMDSLDESLDKLQTDYVDLLLLHWPFPDQNMENALRELMKVQDAGKTKYIGVSNYTIEHLEKAHKITNGRIVTNQVENHPFIPQAPVLKWLKNHDMFMTAYSPLGRGNVLQNGVISDIADRHDKTPGQVTLRWQIQKGVSPIPKAASEEHIKDNFDIFDFNLSVEEMENIDNLAAENKRFVDPDFAPQWDTAKAA